MGFPDGSVIKNPLANAGDTGSIPGSGRSPGGGNGTHSSIFLPGKSHGHGTQEPGWLQSVGSQRVGLN